MGVQSTSDATSARLHCITVIRQDNSGESAENDPVSCIFILHSRYRFKKTALSDLFKHKNQMKHSTRCVIGSSGFKDTLLHPPFSRIWRSSLLWRTTCDFLCHSHHSSGCQISLSGLPGAGFLADPSGQS